VVRVGHHGDGLSLQCPGIQAGQVAAGSGAPRVPQRRRGRSPQVQAGVDVAAAERDLGAYHGVEHRHIPWLVRVVRRCQLQLAFRLVVGAPLQVGPHDCLAQPVRGGPRPECLDHRQRRAQVTQRLVVRTGLVHQQAQFADPGVRAGPEPGAATSLPRGERPPRRRQRAVQVAGPLQGVAGHVVGHARDQRLVALAQRMQGREVRLG